MTDRLETGSGSLLARSDIPSKQEETLSLQNWSSRSAHMDLLLTLLLLLFMSRLPGGGSVWTQSRVSAQKSIDTPDARAGVPLSVTKGGDSVWTQSRVSAQKGGSVSIPCHYDQQYRDSVKYWCRGLLWPTCIVLLRTDSPQRRAGLSITDDPAQHVFTVTMTNLQLWNSNKYWCAVEIKGINTPDARAGVFLSVTKGGDSVWTQSRVSAQKGGSVSIPCHYDQQYRDSVKYWCRGLLWPTCIVLLRTDSPQRRAGLSITDDPAQHVFTVTMTNLQLWNSNKYWCAVEIKGISTPDARAGVFLSVTKVLPPTTPQAVVSTATLPSAGGCLDCTSPPSSAHSAQPPALSPSPPPPTAAPVTPSASPLSTLKTAPTAVKTAPPATPVTPESRAGQEQYGLHWWQSLLLACGVLMLVAAVAMVTWKTWRQRKNSYSSWESDEMESNLMLHRENENHRTGLIPLYRSVPSQGEHLF